MLKHIGLYQIPQCREFPQSIILVECFVTGRPIEVGSKVAGILSRVKNCLCAAEFVGDEVVCIWGKQSSQAVHVYSADTQYHQATEHTTVNPWHVIKCQVSVIRSDSNTPTDD